MLLPIAGDEASVRDSRSTTDRSVGKYTVLRCTRCLWQGAHRSPRYVDAAGNRCERLPWNGTCPEGEDIYVRKHDGAGIGA